jgi:hypothetical protein
MSLNSTIILVLDSFKQIGRGLFVSEIVEKFDRTG